MTRIEDESPWSFVIALNSQRKKGHRLGDTYENGGTGFLGIGQKYVPEAGEGIFFHGKNLHEGYWEKIFII